MDIFVIPCGIKTPLVVDIHFYFKEYLMDNEGFELLVVIAAFVIIAMVVMLVAENIMTYGF